MAQLADSTYVYVPAALSALQVADAEGDALTLSLSAPGASFVAGTDADLGTPGFQLIGSASQINAALQALGLVSDSVGVLSLNLVLSDSHGASSSATHSLNVLTQSVPPPPAPPPTPPEPPLPPPPPAPPSTAGGYALQADALAGQPDPDAGSAQIGALHLLPATSALPEPLQAPLGLLQASVRLSGGSGQESFSIYVAGDLAVNGLWVQDAQGGWVNLASPLMGGQVVRQEDGRLRLDFQVSDGGPFDADGQANGQIELLALAGQMPLSLIGQAPDGLTPQSVF